MTAVLYQAPISMSDKQFGVYTPSRPNRNIIWKWARDCHGIALGIVGEQIGAIHAVKNSPSVSLRYPAT